MELSRPILVLLLCVAAGPAAAGEVGGDYFCGDIKKPFFRSEAGPSGTARIVPGRPRAVPFEFVSPKPAGTARVFVVGESAAALLGRGEDRLLEFLGAAFPGKKTELANCGMPAYESRRILGVFEETLSYQPDLLILLSGNNETGQDFCPDFRSDMDRRARRIKTRLAGLSLPPEEAPAAVSLAIHESRLREMAALAKKKGVPVLFCTLPANLEDFPPSGYPPEGSAEGIRLSYRDPEAALKFFARRGGPREPFSLFYSGRALEALGRRDEAKGKYEAAAKYDPALDRASAERNAMIRRVAKEEGACLADLEKAFSSAGNGLTGGAQLADGVHWFRKYSPFVNAVLGRAAAGCLSVPEAKIPQPRSLLPAGPAPEDFPVLLSYACSYSLDQAANRARAGEPLERLVAALDRLRKMDGARLDHLLADKDALRQAVIENPWNPALKRDLDKWRPALLRAAAEMFRRAGKEKDAAKAEAGLPAAPGPGTAGGADGAVPERPFRAGETEGKRLADKAVKSILAGDLKAAKELLEKAAKADPDSLETRLTACALAARAGDAAFGEDQCGEAVYLAAYPPKHARPVSDGQAAAFFSRAVMRLGTGNKDACGDLALALKKASAAWPQAAEAKTLARKRCPGKK